MQNVKTPNMKKHLIWLVFKGVVIIFLKKTIIDSTVHSIIINYIGYHQKLTILNRKNWNFYTYILH